MVQFQRKCASVRHAGWWPVSEVNCTLAPHSTPTPPPLALPHKAKNINNTITINNNTNNKKQQQQNSSKSIGSAHRIAVLSICVMIYCPCARVIMPAYTLQCNLIFIFVMPATDADCSKECQKSHWKTHKPTCKANRKVKKKAKKAEARFDRRGDHSKRYRGYVCFGIHVCVEVCAS